MTSRACKEAGIPLHRPAQSSRNPDTAFPAWWIAKADSWPEVPEFGGSFVKEDYYPEGGARSRRNLNPRICASALRLKEDNKAFRVEKYKHDLPPLLANRQTRACTIPLDSWFIRASAAKERMAELNRTILWKPESTGTGRFGQCGSKTCKDWNLSRSRYWGVPLPIWRTEDASEELLHRFGRGTKRRNGGGK
jgi:isoleucyl-tRNA synthetase